MRHTGLRINMGIDIVFYIHCASFLSVIVGGKERNCSTYFTEIPAIQMCDQIETNYSFPKAPDLTPSIHINRTYFLPNVTFCSCVITILPIPRAITLRYRTSQNGGCRIIPTMMSELNTLECITYTIRVNKTSENESIFRRQTINNDSYVCFGITIEDQYLEGRSLNVTCSPAVTSPFSPNADLDAFKISTHLDLLAIPSDTITESRLTLTYSTGISYDIKHYETSPLPTKPTDNDTNHGNTSTSEGDKETINANGTIQNDDNDGSHWIEKSIIAVSSVGVCVILFVSIALIYRRANRRKKDLKAPTIKYTITERRENSDDLVITDNLVYNLDEADSNTDVNADNEDVQEITENNEMVQKVENIQEEYSNANRKEVVYTNSQRIDMSQAELFTMNRKKITKGATSEQDFLTDDEKMDLYANKYITRNKSMLVEDDQVYSNDYTKQRLDCGSQDRNVLENLTIENTIDQ